MANGFSTIGEMSAAAAQAQTRNNPFESLATGFQQGQSDANQMLQRQLQMKQMQIQGQYKQQELQQQKDTLRLSSLHQLASAEDPAVIKMLAENHKNMGQKMGWQGDDNWVDLLSKSADARKAVLGHIDGSKLADPAYQGTLISQLTATGGDPIKITKMIQDMATEPTKLAQSKLMAQARQNMNNDKFTQSTIKAALPFATPEDAKILSDPGQIGTDEHQAALERSAMAMAASKQNTQKIKDTGAAARTQNIGVNQQEKIFQPIEKSIQPDMTAARRLQHTDALLKPGMTWDQYALAVDDVLYGVKNSSRMNVQEQQSLGMNSLAKKLDMAKQFVTNKREGGPSDALVAELNKTKESVRQKVVDPAAQEWASQAASKVASGEVDEQTARARFNARFGLDYDKYAKSGGGGGTPSSAPAPDKNGNYAVGGKNFSEASLRAQAGAAKDKAAAAAQFKQITGKDL